jgi:ABC-type lipoprotein release transport system permease subunit
VAFFTTAEAAKRETIRVTRDMGFNLRIIPRETDMDRFWADGFSDRTMPEDALQRLARYPRVFFAYNHLVATLQRRFELQGRNVVLAGVSPAITAPEQRLRPMGYQIKPGTVVAGAQVAQRLGLKKGSRLELGGRSFAVESCLAETGTAEDITLYGALADVQRVLGLPGRINEIKAIDCLCLTADQDPLRILRTELERALPEARVLQLRVLADARAKQRQTGTRYFQFLTPLLLAACAAWIAVLAVQNVRERRAEIGIWRALGHGSGRVAALFLGKAALIGVLAAPLGYAAGTALALQFGPGIFRVTAASIGAEPRLLPWALLVTPLFAAVASFVPAMLAVTLDPAETLREA